ncbi:hypothetical protein F383_11511 [Gossypium arboreum]|uniref:Uncharacterized protein n=1 Tax=Gossypium arboreum TaxID=29729 RepID=A0A0B0N910_GOSAR|nr:hypothetical protein F383_11511 [Gossypium arboreum]
MMAALCIFSASYLPFQIIGSEVMVNSKEMNMDILREMHGMIYPYTLFLLVFGGCLPVFEALTTYAKVETFS